MRRAGLAGLASMRLGETPGLVYASDPFSSEQGAAMRAAILAVAAAGLLTPQFALAATAAAPANASTEDARCLLTMAVLTSAKDAETARSAQMGVVFFAGRLKAREPNYDFTARLKPIAASLTGQNLKPDIERCGPIVQSAMNQLDGALRALSPPEPAPSQTPAPAPGRKP
jgi:hypothetical protein